MASSSSENFSSLLQLLHQELLREDEHEAVKENLCHYFETCGSDQSQIDLLRTAFQKATLDTKAFNTFGENGQNIAPHEFSQRLVNELSKKYKETKEFTRRIKQLEDINDSFSSSNSKNVSFEDAVSQYRDVRSSVHNLEAAIIKMYDQNLRGHIRSKGGRDNRHSTAYDEQIVTLRKKLQDWKLVWGTDGVSSELQKGGFYSYIPLRRDMYGYPEIIFGTSETNIQGSMVTSGTIIGLRVPQKQFLNQKMLWESYTSLLELNSTFPSRLFPLPLGVSRDKRTSSTTFSFEYPVSPTSVSSLQTKVSGNSELLPLRSFLYDHHESNRRVFSHAMRHYPDVIEMWCSQFGQAYRVLQHFPHIQYSFNYSNLSLIMGEGNGVSELVNADVFVREDGTLVLGNAMIMTEETHDFEFERNPMRNTDPLVKVVTSLLQECLCLSRSVDCVLENFHDLDDIKLPEYIKKIESELQMNALENNDYNMMEAVNGAEATASIVYLAEGCGLDIIPKLRSSSCSVASSQSTVVLFIEHSNESGKKSGSKASSSRLLRKKEVLGRSSESPDEILRRLLKSKSNFVVKMTSTDANIVELTSVNGYDVTMGRKTTDANSNVLIDLPGSNPAESALKSREGLSLRFKAKAPGVAYINFIQRTDFTKGSGTANSNNSNTIRKSDLYNSLTFKICVVEFPVSKSTNLCEVVSLCEASFWTPLRKPFRNISRSPNLLESGGNINCTVYRDQVITANAFTQRLSDSNAGKVHRLWHQIRQILVDNTINQTGSNVSSSAAVDMKVDKLFNDKGEVNDGVQENVIVGAEDEYLVDQVLKNKLYDNDEAPPSADDLITTAKTESSNRHLRYPENTYHRKPSGMEARSLRRPQGEKAWK